MVDFIANLLQDDVGSAILDTIVANAALFPFIGFSGTDFRIEYGKQTIKYSEHNGVCLIEPLTVQPVEDNQYEGSAQSDFPFSVTIETTDKRSRQNHVSRVGQAMRSVFGDRGDQVFTNFTDTGSNEIGGGREMTVGASGEIVDPRGLDFVTIETLINIRMWHKLPLTTPV